MSVLDLRSDGNDAYADLLLTRFHCQDDMGNLWAGTQGLGALRLTWSSRLFTNWKTDPSRGYDVVHYEVAGHRQFGLFWSDLPGRELGQQAKDRRNCFVCKHAGSEWLGAVKDDQGNTWGIMDHGDVRMPELGCTQPDGRVVPVDLGIEAQAVIAQQAELRLPPRIGQEVGRRAIQARVRMAVEHLADAPHSGVGRMPGQVLGSGRRTEVDVGDDGRGQAGRVGQVGHALQPFGLADRIGGVDIGLHVHRLDQILPFGVMAQMAHQVVGVQRTCIAPADIVRRRLRPRVVQREQVPQVMVGIHDGLAAVDVGGLGHGPGQ